MLAVTRFKVEARDEANFRALAEAASEFYRTRDGNLDAEVVRSLDDPSLWALVSRWRDVGSYRRSYSGYDAKMILTPLLYLAIDEPGAFDAPDAVGGNQPRGAEEGRGRRPGERTIA